MSNNRLKGRWSWPSEVNWWSHDAIFEKVKNMVISVHTFLWNIQIICTHRKCWPYNHNNAAFWKYVKYLKIKHGRICMYTTGYYHRKSWSNISNYTFGMRSYENECSTCLNLESLALTHETQLKYSNIHKISQRTCLQKPTIPVSRLKHQNK